VQDDKTFEWPGQRASSSREDKADDGTPSAGTDVFRNWLSRAPASRRRASFDPTLYTWKGYRQWKDGVDKQWIEGDD
jgi:hypothetical protein